MIHWSAAFTLSPAVVVPLVEQLGGTVLRTLPIVNGLAIDLPSLAIPTLALSPYVARISLDRRAGGTRPATANWTWFSRNAKSQIEYQFEVLPKT